MYGDPFLSWQYGGLELCLYEIATHAELALQAVMHSQIFAGDVTVSITEPNVCASALYV